jgi:hypothetical protein
MNDELKKACEEWSAHIAQNLACTPGITHDGTFTTCLLGFAKQQRAAVWREAPKFFDAMEDPENPLTCGQLIHHFIEHCEHKARELES